MKKIPERQVKTAISRSPNRGSFMMRLDQMYPIYETDLSVPIKNDELPSLPEFPSAARISEFLEQLEELMGRMNRTSYRPTDPHHRLVGTIPPQTWEDCRETSESKARTHSNDDLIDLLIKLAMERESDMDKYLCKHLRRVTLAERTPGGGLPETAL